MLGSKRRRGRGGAVDNLLGGPDAATARLQDTSSLSHIALGASQLALDFSSLELKPDAARRPFWVTPTGSVFLEASCPPHAPALYEVSD